MSRGPGQIEQRIGELFAATEDQALSITDNITDQAFDLGGKLATRAQGLSATRATHRLLRLAEAVSRKTIPAFEQSLKEAQRILGRPVDQRTHDSAIFTVGGSECGGFS